mgnify:CR=1 FL=1
MIAKFVLGWYSNIKDKEKITIHASTFYDDPRPETRKMRRLWIPFVQSSMDDFSVRYIVLPRI